MVATQSKTRAEQNNETKAQRHSRKIKRATEGRYTYVKAVKEAEKWGFKVIRDEATWNAQALVRPSRRKLRIVGRNPIHLDSIMSGHIRSDAPSEEEKVATKAKQSKSHKDRGLGQINWHEQSAIKAALLILDPTGLVKKKDGKELQGGCYAGHILLGVVFTITDRDAALKEMKTFDAVPEVVVGQIFLYKSAADLPCASLQPYPRLDKNDKYGDNRYVVGFDDDGRLCRMRETFLSLVQERAIWGSEQLWFAMGPGTPNTCVSTEHASEVLNIKALAELVGFQSLQAPERQNETVDVVWSLNDEDIRISVKTASIDKKGFMFGLGKHPHHEYCDLVLGFYKDGSGNRTGVSVISAARVYAEREVKVERKTFNWSKTNNKDVLCDTVDLSKADAMDSVVARVLCLMPKDDASAADADNCIRLCFDGGSDLDFIKLLGDPHDAMCEAARRYLHLFGNSIVTHLPVGAALSCKFGANTIIAAPTMILPQPVPNTNNAYTAFKMVLELLEIQKAANNVSVPGLCTGTGKMDPYTSARQILGAWNDHQNGLRCNVLHEGDIVYNCGAAMQAQPDYYMNISSYCGTHIVQYVGR
ncbi:hypothetical protein JKP88DRAFT_241108 [Tribonema minus]|uniref:Uncharacterized protein n=1 Tax=Tribonema minus TaxID=303371 RepID=A0A835Z7R5_9STRA|nr:hypothetical protein JKP88DRAFT_241108 [Tribonema minus]